MNFEQLKAAQKLEQQLATLIRHQDWVNTHGIQVVCPVNESNKLVLSLTAETHRNLVDGIQSYFAAQIADTLTKLAELGVEG